MTGDKSPLTWSSWRSGVGVHITIIVGVFVLIGFMGDRFFLTRTEGERLASKLEEIARVVKEIQEGIKERTGIMAQQGALIERSITILDEIERRSSPKKE